MAPIDSMPMKDQIERRSFLLPFRCHYLLRKPERPSPSAFFIVALHGHAMTAEQMLWLTVPLVGEEHYTAALQGPYQIWVNRNGEPRADVAFHWATRFEPEHSWRLHHDMILTVIAEMGASAEHVVLVGFSQSVALNYRFLCTHPNAVRGAIAICGGIPGDWERRPYQHSPAAVLHIAAREDEYYPPAVAETFPERLRTRIPDLEFHMLDGGHRIPTAARPIMQAWLARLRR